MSRGVRRGRAYSCRGVGSPMLRRSYADRARPPAPDGRSSRRLARWRGARHDRDAETVPGPGGALVARRRGIRGDGSAAGLRVPRHLGRRGRGGGHLRARVRDPALARLVRRPPRHPAGQARADPRLRALDPHPQTPHPPAPAPRRAAPAPPRPPPPPPPPPPPHPPPPPPP